MLECAFSWGRLQSRIHGLALEGEDPEDALVNAIERLTPREALERFDA